MNNIKSWLFGASLLVLSGFAVAEKIAVLDMQSAMMGTDVAKQRIEALQKNPEFVALRARLESLVADITALQQTAEKDGMTWSEEQLAEHRKKIEYLRADYELAGNKLQSEQQQVLQRVQQQLSPKIAPVLDQLIKDEKIGLIINAQSVFHASGEYDITAKVAEGLNKAN
ncbi:MAG TPA: OmpH family outer membrane protein [Cellvibrionaceae bacterium]